MPGVIIHNFKLQTFENILHSQRFLAGGRTFKVGLKPLMLRTFFPFLDYIIPYLEAFARGKSPF
ncbi:hypothetical protein HMPREF9103_00483 [Lentilactobacillus parafarraginis F0439]|uniref:Uncharacterized protein n=1 Tax=Lentilactobacillus parafarraginis F0439 TaxID=797515 RepID=G9ZL85_9LACO|nr:hypothetical protein HMPREF9103_00483 [Lentilactobacillus parafarraginis F0439]